MIKPIHFTNVNPISKIQDSKIKKEINSVILKKDFILGHAVSSFESEFSKISKIKYSIGCASGTDALILALKSLNLKKNDEVIVPAMTYISTGLSIILNNNKLVLSDVDNETGLISLKDVSRKINQNTKAIIPVNLYGQKVDLKNLRRVVGRNIAIIEDAAQSHFSFSCYQCKRKNNNICCKKERNDNFADISCYSFYPSKNLGAYGDGGLVATNNKKLYLKIRSKRNLGSIKKHRFKFIGMNSRLDTIQAVILKNKLKYISNQNDIRRKIARKYDEAFSNIDKIKLTKTNPGSSRHLYVIRSKKRDLLIKYLAKKKIHSQIHYPYNLSNIEPFKKFIKQKVNLKNSNSWSKQCLSLPIHPKLKNSEIYKVIKEIKEFFIK